MLEALIIGGVALIIANLIVRDQTQFRISRLRSELMGLNSEEKRLSERRDEVELMVAQIGDALMRADRRRKSLEQGCDATQASLEALKDELGSEDDDAESTPTTDGAGG